MLSLFLNCPGPGGSPHPGVLSPRLALCFQPDWHLLTETEPAYTSPPHQSSVCCTESLGVGSRECTHWTSSEISRGYYNNTILFSSDSQGFECRWVLTSLPFPGSKLRLAKWEKAPILGPILAPQYWPQYWAQYWPQYAADLEEFLIPCPCYQESICGDEAASVLKNTPFAGSLEAVNSRQTAKQKEKQEIFRRQIIFPNVSNRKHLPNTVHHKQLQRNQNEDDQHFN